MGINVSRVKIENLHVNNYESSDSESEDEIVVDNNTRNMKRTSWS